MKTLKTKTIILLLVTIIAGAGLLTSCDAVLEAFYPELTELSEGEIVVYVNFDSNLFDINEFVYGTVNIKVALMPFLETSSGFYMQEDQAIIKSFSITEFDNRFKEIGFYPQGNRIFKIIVWLDRDNNDIPDWDDIAYPEPSVLATNTWNGDWWVDFRWGYDRVEMDSYVSLGDTIVEQQLSGHPDDIGGVGGVGEPPVANPQAGRTSIAVGESVNFWENSWDPDGFITGREWWIQGPGVDDTFNQPSLNFYFPEQGEYLVYLKVWDNEGNESSLSEPIRIYAVETYFNQSPTASFWADRAWIQTGETVRFESTSWDPDDGIMTRYWDFDDGSEYNGGDTEWHSFGTAGTYYVELTVTDYSNESDSSVIEINVLGSGVTNREIIVEGDIYGISSYSSPIRVKLLSLWNNPGMEVAARTIYGASYIYEIFDYLPEDNYAVIVWWDENNNDNPDPGEPGAFGDNGMSTSLLSNYGINVPDYDLKVGSDVTEYAYFDFDNLDGDFIFSAPGGSEGTAGAPIYLGINTVHYGAYVDYEDYSYYWLDNLSSYTGDGLEIQLMNLSADIDLYVYGATSFGDDYNNATGLVMIGSSTWGGTTWESVIVPSGHSYNSIFIQAYGYQEGSYEVRIDFFLMQN
jgi:PKD repeat protein